MPTTASMDRAHPLPDAERTIAYFSMEIGIESSMPTYSGGLGVLAGDTIRAAADLGVPMVAVTLLHRKGYFRQKIDDRGRQWESPVEWVIQDHLAPTTARVEVQVEGRRVALAVWRYTCAGVSGADVPILFLDSDLPENADEDRHITDSLYAGDLRHRMRQEIVLGIGGVRALRAAGFEHIQRYHMNEGHAALLTFELLRDSAATAGRNDVQPHDIATVRRKCVFTTHTPVAAGHDRFPADIASAVLGSHPALALGDLVWHEGMLNMTHAALNLSRYVNGVAKRHAEVSRLMFAPHEIDSITNGVHAATWTSEPFARLFDARMHGWREDNFVLRHAVALADDEVCAAHADAKDRLIGVVNRDTNAAFERDRLTLGFARRATGYKRPDLVLSDPERLARISRDVGPLQIVFAGKAHPHDHQGKDLIQKVFEAAAALAPGVKIAFLPGYDIDLAKVLVAGCDVWLNTPLPPLEASGTSGMKAALNGVPSLSVLDGWWIEGCVEGVTGWAVGGEEKDRSGDAGHLYDKLEHIVAPAFFRERARFVEIMRHAIAINGSFFNTQRMVLQYVTKAYFKQ